MILIINGSPNKKSKTMSVVYTLLADSKDRKIVLNPYNMNIQSCDDCKYCEKVLGCNKNDDMNQVYELLNEADTLIISSPVYFGSLSDQAMKLINRFQRYYGQKFVLKDNNIPTFKNLILVSTQGSEKLRMFNGPLETMNILERLFKPIYSDNILIPVSDSIPLLSIKNFELVDNIKKRMIKYKVNPI